MATELDVDVSEAMDADIKEEEDALVGHQVNPTGVDYSCIAWLPCAPDGVFAAVVGWDCSRLARALGKNDFACTAAGVASKLQAGLAGLAQGFRAEMERAKQ